MPDSFPLYLRPVALFFLVLSSLGVSEAAAAPLALTCDLPAAQVGVAYSGSCTATDGQTPYVYSVYSSSPLPDGLTLDSTSGVVSGIPTRAGTSSFAIIVTDSTPGTPQTASQGITDFLVNPPGLILNCSASTTAQVGVAYAGNCSAQNGQEPYTYSVDPASTLPDGLAIGGASGTITGMPTTPGTSSFTIVVTDSSATPQTASFVISSFTVAPLMLTLNCTLPASGQVGTAYSGSCVAAGGTPSYTYSVSVGTLPGGLTIDSATGTVAGMPLSAGSNSFTITVTDGASQTATSNSTITIGAPPPPTLALNCALSGTAQVGVAYSGSCTAGGGMLPYTYSISGSSLPAGLNIDAATGAISGMPTTPGPSSFTVAVSDGGGQTASAPGTITVTPPTLTLQCSLPGAGQVAVAYSGSCTATGGTAPYTYSVTSGSLPGGLNISSSSGAVTGSPASAGASTFTVTVTDSAQQTANSIATITIAPLTLTLACPLPAAGQVGSPYSGLCSASGGTTPYTYSISAGSPPNGLGINPSTGAIAGTPLSAGSSTFSVTVTDAGAHTATQQTTINISPATLTLTCSLPNGQKGTAYSASCTAGGGTPGYTYSIGTPSFPGGLTIGSSGVISGIPTATGTQSFTINVSDNAGQSASYSSQVTIAFSTLMLTCPIPGTAQVGVPYSGTCSASGGNGPFTYSVSGSSLPQGLTINSGNGQITGTPTFPGSYNFTVNVADSSGQTASSANQIVVATPTLLLSCNLPQSAKVGVDYSGSCTASGGTASYTYAVSSGSLPGGLNLNSQTGAVSGRPTSPGTVSVTIRVTDASQPAQSATQTATIIVAPPTLTVTCTLSSGQAGVSYLGRCLAGGGTPGYTYSVSAGSLPGGLSIDASSGVIAGTPANSGTSSFTVKVADSGGQQTTYAAQIAVAASTLSITTAQLGAGVINIAYSAVLSAMGGTPPYTWSASGLPLGLTISSDGRISGTPTTAGGANSIVITVADNDNSTQRASKGFSITIYSQSAITTASLPNGIVGKVYSSTTLIAQGGTQPYNWTATNVPQGLTLSTGGVLSGTPTTAGTFNINVSESDSSSPVQTATHTFPVIIYPTLTITTSSLPNGFTNTAYPTTALAASGGATPYTWSATGLPAGLTLNSAGSLSGVPTASGTFTVNVSLTDSGTPSQTATQSLTLKVSAGLAITTLTLDQGTAGIPFSATFTAQHGTAPYQWSISGQPAELTLDASTGTLKGTPSGPGTYTLTVSVSDNGNPKQSASQQFSLVINPATAPVTPTFSFSGLPTSTAASQTIPKGSVQLSTVSSAAWPVTISLSFAPDAAGVSAGYADPALQFVDDSGNKTGTTYSVTIPAQTTSVPLPLIASGTVAGNIKLTLQVTGQTGATANIAVPRAAPVIETGSVQILNVGTSNFNVELVGYSSPRDVKTAHFAFSAAPGAQLTGTTAFDVDVSALLAGWYSGTASQAYGSAFTLTVPFNFSGNVAAIQSVTVTLVNSQGTSNAVTGTR